MKNLLLISMLALFGSTAFAHHFDGDSDMEQSVQNDHSDGVVSTMIHAGLNDEYGSVLLDNSDDLNNLPPTAAGRAAMNKGIGDEFGSVLLDI